ncbi:alpha/beta hydrolase [Halarchaeum salinum]|uniref:Alpha/beta hydrolase n=1 Tax=Halarchaeum salinum TaxID=489912 RepID=A0AAV3S807_9EURY
MADEPSADVRSVLDHLSDMDRPETHELSPKRAREAARELGADDPVVEVGTVTERVISGPSRGIPIRVYEPASDGPSPAVVFFHGGGFVYGDFDTHDPVCRHLTNDADVAVISVDYRLAPEHPFPAAVEDAYAATEWIAANADALAADVDGERLAVAGDSAGGNLAAVVALAARDRGGPEIRHQALVYPVTDFRASETYPSYEENGEDYYLSAADMAYFRDHYLDSWVHPTNPYCSPLAASSHADLPPATLVTCGFDPLCDEGIAYAESLDAAGTPVTHRHYGDLIHGVVNMVAPPLDVTGGREIIEDIATDLREALD